MLKEEINTISKDLPVQLHYQLTNVLRQYIENGNWTVGDLFLTDREIMERYNVSATTTRRAVIQLVNEGWLERKPGKGTFIVKEPLKEQLGSLTGFFEEMRTKGYEPSAEIIFAGPLDIDETLLKRFPALKKFEDKKIFLVEKIHKFNNKIASYVHCFWRKEYGEKFAAFDLSKEGTYGISKQHFNVNLTVAEETISAVAANKKEAGILEIKQNAPLLLMERLTYADSMLVEFSYNLYRADRYRYNLTLKNTESLS